MLIILSVQLENDARPGQLPWVVFVEACSQSVFGVADALGTVELLWLLGFRVGPSVSRGDCADERFGGGHGVHHLVPWRLGDGVAGEHLVVELLGDGLEDSGGSYLSATHDGLSRPVAEGEVRSVCYGISGQV